MSYSHLHPWKALRPWERHSLVLFVAGLVYALVGVAYMTSETLPSREKALHYALLWMPINAWGVVFIIAGTLAVVSSRWPPISSTWGYTVLSGLSGGWSAFFAVGVLFGYSPATNLSGVLVWGLMAFLWWAISGLTNPVKIIVEMVPPPVDEDHVGEE